MSFDPNPDFQQLAQDIKLWGTELGFQQVGITDTDLSEHQQAYRKWLAEGHHGSMAYLNHNGDLREDPAKLLPGTLRVISVRLDYLPADAGFAQTLSDDGRAYISRYALGRDYHKLVRKRLKQLGEKIQSRISELHYRPFVDSAPIMERPLAAKAGLGWIGKHTLLLNRQAGSWFFLGELLVNLPLPTDAAVEPSCGECVACLKICPTGAITAPYQLDARRCISYLTIEQDGPIPIELRAALGNRIYGCDDCQLVCPWNRYAQLTQEADFAPRNALDRATLCELFSWSEAQFLKRTEGSPIRRIGYASWLRNIAVALGNAKANDEILTLLASKIGDVNEMVAEHIDWAITQQKEKLASRSRKTERLIRIVEKGLPRDA
jgi:epoxyqueuosine reductase